KSFGTGPIVKGLSLRLMLGDRMAIVGPNGAGKTTLLRLLTGVLAPDSGMARVGTNLQMVVLDQRRDSLDPGRTLQETLTGGSGDTVTVNGRPRHVIGYMKDFLFSPEQARTPVGRLSGGERGRLMLAVALAQPSNILVLDEPTNDLDIETLDLLQDLLGDYPGTALIVSHDRDFLDRVATSVVVAEGHGRWGEYAGGYSDMLAQRGAGVAARPHAANKERKTPAAARSRLDQVRKLTFKDQHRLDVLLRQIAELEQRVAHAQAVLADPTLYARDQMAFKRASAALAEASRELAAAEEEWLALELRREELEQK
ncbi:MAG: ATP-binding cassette domain-containing protein, partial [Alphaproteobacteria bacterium]|nr:ATP-binding cassette domain-containing protein [Alphaproteobacteria bacterium]